MASYILSDAETKSRLHALESIYDRFTFDLLDRIGVSPGSSCLEVGGGAGSVAQRLCQATGPPGRVLATDLDTRFLDQIALPNLKVERHDVRDDPLPEDAFDLVHARAVVEHLPDPEAALASMVRAVKPGGVLFIEDSDYISWSAASWEDPVDAELFESISPRVFKFLEGSGARCFFGRRLPALLRENGLADVAAEGHAVLVRGGTGAANFWGQSWEMLRDRMIESGLIGADELDRFIALHRGPTFEWMSPIIVQAWGRKPA